MPAESELSPAVCWAVCWATMQAEEPARIWPPSEVRLAALMLASRWKRNRNNEPGILL